MPASYANSATLTVQALLKQPARLSREITALTNKKLVSRRLFNRGPAAVGGSVEYEREQGIYMDRASETIAERAKWPRVGYSEDIRTDSVTQNGLEFPVSNLASRRHRTDVVRRGQVRLANTLARDMDSAAMAVLEGDADIQTVAASALWTTLATDIPDDIAEAQEMIEEQDLGYDGFSGPILVVHTDLRRPVILNEKLLTRLPRESQNAVQTGTAVPMLGLSGIIYTPRITRTLALLVDATIAGTVMDEIPDPSEGWTSFSADPTADQVYVMTYDDKSTKDTIVAAGRWPVYFLTDPKAVVKITGVAA